MIGTTIGALFIEALEKYDFGEGHPIMEMAVISGLPEKLIRRRLRDGWSTHRAINGS
jgi:hypothetical protein